MIEWLIYIGLSLSPFVLMAGYDTRYPKEYFCLGVSCAIAFLAIYNGLLKPFKNRFAFIFILGVILSTAFVPPSGMGVGMARDGAIAMLNRTDVDNLWNFKPIVHMLIYLMLIVSIASTQIKDIKPYLKIIAWTATITAAMIILQSLGFNELMTKRSPTIIGLTRSPDLTAFLGQYTLASSFMALCFLSTIYLRKYWMSALIMLATFLTTSRLSMFAIIAGVMFIPFIQTGKKHLFYLILSFIVIATVGMFFTGFQDNGRFDIWKTIIQDLRSPLDASGLKYSFTGFGAGSFRFAYPIIHGGLAYEAHNEYLELLFNNGFMGLFLFLGAIGSFFSSCFKVSVDRDVRFLICMAAVSCTLAFGTFFWQLSVGGFYTAVIVGLAYNAIRRHDERLA
jgi:hypothetical protein